jgi:hypothetical protein
MPFAGRRLNFVFGRRLPKFASSLRQGEGDDLVVCNIRAREAAARADHGHELPPIRAHIRGWRRLDR